MRLKSIKVSGFRSLQNLTAPLEPYSCLIGRNDAGKSSLLRAIQLLLDPNEKAVATDFCNIGGNAAAQIIIEGEFIGCPASLSFSDGGSALLRRTISQTLDFYEARGQTPVSPTLKAMLAGKLTKGELKADESLPDEIREASNSLPGRRLSVQQWQEFYAQIDGQGWVEKEPGMAPASSAHVSDAFDVIFLTADMRAAEEAADSSKSIFSRLGGILYREACLSHPELVSKRAELDEILLKLASKNEQGKWIFESVQKLEDVLQEELNRFDPDVRITPKAESAKLPAISFPFKLDVEDGLASGLQCMGHGLRRSLVFAMLRTLSRMPEIAAPAAEGAPAPPEKFKAFLIEEPELYLHPQAERARMRDLQDLGDKPMTQVLACTHSAFFVDMSRYRSILRMERPGRAASNCFSWSGPDLDADEQKKLKAVRAMHPTSSAALFADVAILSEGATEVGCLPALASGLGLDISNIEVVDCGGGGSIPAMARICDAIGVRYVTWFDQDQNDSIAKVQGAATAGRLALVVLSPDWETVAAIPGAPFKKKEKPWRSYQHFILNGAALTPMLELAIKAAYQHTNFDMRTLTGGSP